MRPLCLILMLVGGFACGKDSPTAPSPPVVPACQTNQTATLTAENRSAGATYDVVLDGGRVATLAPGTTSSPLTITALVTHRLDFRYSNTSRAACAPLFPSLPICGSQTYYCTF